MTGGVPPPPAMTNLHDATFAARHGDRALSGPVATSQAIQECTMTNRRDSSATPGPDMTAVQRAVDRQAPPVDLSDANVDQWMAGHEKTASDADRTAVRPRRQGSSPGASSPPRRGGNRGFRRSRRGEDRAVAGAGGPRSCRCGRGPRACFRGTDRGDCRARPPGGRASRRVPRRPHRGIPPGGGPARARTRGRPRRSCRRALRARAHRRGWPGRHQRTSGSRNRGPRAQDTRRDHAVEPPILRPHRADGGRRLRMWDRRGGARRGRPPLL